MAFSKEVLNKAQMAERQLATIAPYEFAQLVSDHTRGAWLIAKPQSVTEAGFEREDYLFSDGHIISLASFFFHLEHDAAGNIIMRWRFCGSGYSDDFKQIDEHGFVTNQSVPKAILPEYLTLLREAMQAFKSDAAQTVVIDTDDWLSSNF